MKVNVSIDINDIDRDKLANMLDGKVTKRLATRKEIVSICQQHIGGLVTVEKGKEDPADEMRQNVIQRGAIGSLLDIDPEDREILAGKSDSYVRGWNQVKRRSK